MQLFHFVTLGHQNNSTFLAVYFRSSLINQSMRCFLFWMHLAMKILLLLSTSLTPHLIIILGLTPSQRSLKTAHKSERILGLPFKKLVILLMHRLPLLDILQSNPHLLRMPFLLRIEILLLKLTSQILVLLSTLPITRPDAIATSMQLSTTGPLRSGVKMLVVHMLARLDGIVGLMVIGLIWLAQLCLRRTLILIFGGLRFHTIIFAANIGVNVLFFVDVLEVTQEGVTFLGHS